MQDTPARASDSTLFETFLGLLQEYRTTVKQARIFHRMVALIFGVLWSLGRHTLTHALLAIGCVDADWSPFYRLFSHDRISMPALQQRLLQQCLQHVPPTHPLMLAVDAVAFPRSTKRFPGVGWRKAPATAPWRPGLSLAQRFGALHWLPPLEHGFSRAIPFLSYPLFTPKARPAAAEPQTEWQGALHALATSRRELAALGRAAQPIVLLGDGSYDVTQLWKALPPQTALVARTARNRVLYQLPVPQAERRRGAKRKYGDQAPRPRDYLTERNGWTTKPVTVRGHERRVRFRVVGPFVRKGAAEHPVFLVLMGGETYRRRGRSRHREPVPVLVSAWGNQADGWQLPLAVDDLLAWLWQRWEVEVAHRELKSGFGVGEMQCWHPLSAVTTVQWGIWLYAVCLLAAYRQWGICGGPQPLGGWRKPAKRWSFSTLWRSLRMAEARLPQIGGVWPRTPTDWGKKAVWVAQMTRAVHTTARL